MTAEHLWTGWRDHDGRGCPYIPGTEVEVEAELSTGQRVRGVETVLPSDLTDRPGPWHAADFGLLVEHRGQWVPMPRILRHRARRHPAADLLIARAMASASATPTAEQSFIAKEK